MHRSLPRHTSGYPLDRDTGLELIYKHFHMRNRGLPAMEGIGDEYQLNILNSKKCLKRKPQDTLSIKLGKLFLLS
jgi:hypothetical protein